LQCWGYITRELATRHVSWTLPDNIIDWLIFPSHLKLDSLASGCILLEQKSTLKLFGLFLQILQGTDSPLPEISSSKSFWCLSYTQWSLEKGVWLVFWLTTCICFVVTVGPRKEDSAGGQ
jgi:hypothetical protein